MKKIIARHNLEKGQVIPIVVVSLIALIAFSALILDGGALLLNRRSAQNAADASALAGARVLCTEGGYDYFAINKAVNDYLDFNNATLVGDWDFIPASTSTIEGLLLGEIVVTAQVEHGSFFARIFNQDFLTAKATAGAGCFPYVANIVLPIAYPCRPPVEGLSESPDCDYFPMDWDDLLEITDKHNYNPYQGNPSSQTSRNISKDLFDKYKEFIYIVVDSDLICGEDLNCNFFDEEDDEYIDRYQLNSGSRGWLNLEGADTGGAGTQMLRDWVRYGVDSIQPYMWLSLIPGNRAQAMYSELDTRLDEIVWIPVIYGLCSEYPEAGKPCYDDAQTKFPHPEGQEDIVDLGNPAYPAARVVAFVPYFPTCTYINQKAVYKGTTYNEKCPGFELAQLNNPDTQPPSYSTIPNNTNSLEGYFIKPESLPGDFVVIGGPDFGLYIVSLTK